MARRNDLSHGSRAGTPVWRPGLVHWCLLSFVAGMGLMWATRPFLSGAQRTATATRGLERGQAPSKPWGRLEFQKLPLYRPDEAFEGETDTLSDLRWKFRATNVTDVLAVLDRAGLTNQSEAALRDTTQWRRTSTGYTLRPTPEVVEQLARVARARLYRVLGQWPENPVQHGPMRFAPGSFEEFTASLHLPEKQIALLKGLAYEDRGAICFADMPLLLARSSPGERRAVLRETSRISALVLALRVESGADVESLARYWGPGRHGRAIRPLLQSVAALPQGGVIPVAQLLPSFARLRLYQYGDRASARSAREDCFWTAMNFFNETPEDGFTEWSKTVEVLRTRYRPVGQEEWTFGDVLIVAEGADTIHMCVHVADDVVFTKNGANVWQPWVFMKLEDMLAIYPTEKGRSILGYRRTEP